MPVPPRHAEAQKHAAAPPPSPDVKGAWGPQKVAGTVVLSVGAVGLGVGAVLGGIAAQKLGASNSDGHCHDGNQCDAGGVALRADAIHFGNASTALFVAGGVVAATGLVVFLTAPKGSAISAKITPVGAAVHGAW